MATLAEEFTALQETLDEAPTVQSGLIDLIVKIRWQIEKHASSEDKMRELARVLDDQCALLADAVLRNTPAEAAHAQRAEQIQAEADTDGN